MPLKPGELFALIIAHLAKDEPALSTHTTSYAMLDYLWRLPLPLESMQTFGSGIRSFSRWRFY
ncbi:hypothetical protein [Bradyrhizobium diazoefficiens]|uniref:hypothetical protein n=1 Tax=Bradyrhizobium diazoefficiens TaxID=1355477 RepID=UPI00272D4D47|nr:hypothetical protein [Bradyrhizobium diazoefficiens]WLA58515.1 hypothetical protein QIH81_07600 [Bradyrhizobium diazoefficiens]